MKMTSAKVVETSVTFTDNNPSRTPSDYDATQTIKKDNYANNNNNNDNKSLSVNLFLYRAQNLPFFLFYLQT